MDAMLQNNIKQLRTQLSITQRELAFMVGTSQQQIQRIETGKVAAKLSLHRQYAMPWINL
jgi:DNA-binding XRE family transcriptional regulator